MDKRVKPVFIVKLSRIITRILAVMLFVALLLYGALYFFLMQDPQEFADKTLADLSARTGLEFSFGSFDVTLLPVPVISVSDMTVKGKNLEFTAAWASVRPNYSRLLFGEFLPGSLTLLRPRLWLGASVQLTDFSELFANSETKATPGSPKARNWIKLLFERGCYLQINQGAFAVSGDEDSALDVANINCNLDLASHYTIEGLLQIAAARLTEGKRAVGRIEQVELQGVASLENFWLNENDFELKFGVNVPKLVDKSAFAVKYKSRSSSHWLDWNFNADLRFDNTPVAAALSGKAAAVAGGPVVLRDVFWQLGPDNGALEGEIQNSEKIAQASFKGLFTAKRLSLTQWFGFARNLCPGLQLTLDNILQARMAFDVSAQGFYARRISAMCAGSTFIGTGKVEDFAKPVIFLDLKTDYANLGLGLEESLARSPVAPWYGHATLTPMPGEPLLPGETSTGYDINLGAAKLRYGPLQIDDATVRIYPGKIDKDGLEDVIVAGKANFYGGAFKGQCILGGPADLPIAITAQAANVNAAKLRRDLSALPYSKGILGVQAEITSRGKELAKFMANLAGQISVTGNNAQIFDVNFQKANAKINLRSAFAGTDSAEVTAKWAASLSDKDYAAEIGLDGKMTFGEKGASFKNLPFNLKINLLDSLAGLPAKTTVNVDGKLGGESSNQKFTLADGVIQGLGARIACSAQIDGDKASATGKLSAQKISLDPLLKNLGYQFEMPRQWADLKFNADFSAKTSQFDLHNLKATLGATPINGSISWQKKADRLKFDLETDKFDMEKSFAGKTKPGSKNWNFKPLQTLNCEGVIKVKKLAGWKLIAENIRMPLKLAGGRLDFGPGTAKFYGAPCNLDGNINFGSNAMTVNAKARINGFNMLLVARALQVKGTLLGKAELDLNLTGRLTQAAQVASALNGTWQARITGGSWQGWDNNNKLKGKPLLFTTAQASGKIENGVFKSDNLLMRGPELVLKGGGSANLNNQKLDCKFDVDMKGVPDFPLTLTGSFRQPKTSIGAGKLVLNAIGGIATGIGDAIGSVAKGFMKIFTK